MLCGVKRRRLKEAVISKYGVAMGSNEWDGVSETNDMVSTAVMVGDGEKARMAYDTSSECVKKDVQSY